MLNELYSICWNITSRCNENCYFCYRKICQDNTLEQNKKIFDNLSQIKIDKLTFSGGEPLLYEQLFELVDYIRSKNPDIKLSITTNGQIIDAELLERILSRFDWITFSIDSPCVEINEKIGRGKDHLSKIEWLLQKCSKRINIKINTVANRYNFNDLESIYRIISRYGVSRWKILTFWPLRKAKNNQDAFSLSDGELKQVEDFVSKKNNCDVGMQIHFNDLDEFSTSYFPIFSDGSIENASCEVIGNLLYDDIFDILSIKQRELTNHSLRKTIL